MDWFLYNRDLRHEQVKSITQHTHRRVTTIFVSGVLHFFQINTCKKKHGMVMTARTSLKPQKEYLSNVNKPKINYEKNRSNDKYTIKLSWYQTIAQN